MWLVVREIKNFDLFSCRQSATQSYGVARAPREPHTILRRRQSATRAPHNPTASPERHTASPERHTASPERHTASPERHTASPERHEPHTIYSVARAATRARWPPRWAHELRPYGVAAVLAEELGVTEAVMLTALSGAWRA